MYTYIYLYIYAYFQDASISVAMQRSMVSGSSVYWSLGKSLKPDWVVLSTVRPLKPETTTGGWPRSMRTCAQAASHGGVGQLLGGESLLSSPLPRPSFFSFLLIPIRVQVSTVPYSLLSYIYI